MIAGSQFLFRFRDIEGRPVDFGQYGDKEDYEGKRVQRKEPDRFLLGLHRARECLAVALASGAVSIALSLWWVPLWGGVGAAASLICAHGVSLAAQGTIVWRVSGDLPEEAEGELPPAHAA